VGRETTCLAGDVEKLLIIKLRKSALPVAMERLPLLGLILGIRRIDLIVYFTLKLRKKS